MIVRGFIRKVSDGTPVPDGTEVVFRRHVDDSLLATTVTSGGMYELVLNGSPGPYYVRAAISDEVHISSSKVVGMSGPVDIGNLPLYFRLWTDGYIVGVLEQMSVFATGSGMQVTVRSGATLVKGVLYDQPGQAVLPVDAADAQPRIDTVVIETMVPGSGIDVEGRTRLVVKKGTPAATPVAPSLTQLVGGIWEHPLANITVDPAVSSIASNKVTDRRVQSNVQIGSGYISTVMLADDSVTAAKMAPNSVAAAEIVNGSVGTTELADGSVTTAKIADATIVAADLANDAVTTNKIADLAVTGAKIGVGAVSGGNGGKIGYRTIDVYNLAEEPLINGIRIFDGAVTNAKIGDGSVTGAKIATASVTGTHIVNGTITGADIAANTLTASNIAANSITGSELADGAVTTTHILNGTIAETDLSSAVVTKLNALDYNHSTEAPHGYINVNSTTASTVATTSMVCSAGTWVFLMRYEGQYAMQSMGTDGSAQISFTPSTLLSSHVIQNVEADSTVANNFCMVRMNQVVVATSSTITFNVQAKKLLGSSGKISGSIGLHGIRIA